MGTSLPFLLHKIIILSVFFLREWNLEFIPKVGNKLMVFEKWMLRILKEGGSHSRQKKIT
jgi:hypothetical protein